MKNPHPKRTQALKMLTTPERQLHVTPFDGLQWKKRKSIKAYKETHKKEIRLECKKKSKKSFISKRSKKNAYRT